VLYSEKGGYFWRDKTLKYIPNVSTSIQKVKIQKSEEYFLKRRKQTLVSPLDSKIQHTCTEMPSKFCLGQRGKDSLRMKLYKISPPGVTYCIVQFSLCGKNLRTVRQLEIWKKQKYFFSWSLYLGPWNSGIYYPIYKILKMMNKLLV